MHMTQYVIKFCAYMVLDRYFIDLTKMDECFKTWASPPVISYMCMYIRYSPRHAFDVIALAIAIYSFQLV